MGIVPLKGGRPEYLAPAPIDPEHRLDAFDCGKPALNDWLKAHALNNEGRASRTYIVATEAMAAAGYFTVAAGHIILTEVPRKYRQGLPNPAPVLVLGRLAVDRQHAGKGLGSSLLQQAFLRAAQVAEIAGIRALIVHAIDDEAVGFYVKYGFQIFPKESRTLFLPIETVIEAVRHS